MGIVRLDGQRLAQLFLGLFVAGLFVEQEGALEIWVHRFCAGRASRLPPGPCVAGGGASGAGQAGRLPYSASGYNFRNFKMSS